MNDYIAEETLEDHKYLLIDVQNRAAIAYFAAFNRNLSLYNALKKYCHNEEADDLVVESKDLKTKKKGMLREKIEKFNKYSKINLIQHLEKSKGSNVTLSFQTVRFLEICFERMLYKYDFLSVVMYPELKSRRQFVHDAWLIAKYTENFELKMAISKDPYFYITREDILKLIKTQDDDMIEHMLKIGVSL